MQLFHLPKSELVICYRVSLKVALVVGTILSVINHYEVLLNGFESYKQVIKLFLNYIVPFSVSIYSQIHILKQQYQQKINHDNFK